MDTTILALIIFALVALGCFSFAYFIYPAYCLSKLKTLAKQLNCDFTDESHNRLERKGLFAKKLASITGNYHNHQIVIDHYNGYSLASGAWWRNIVIKIDGQEVPYPTKVSLVLGWLPDIKTIIDNHLNQQK